jgi:hypothetical protein
MRGAAKYRNYNMFNITTDVTNARLKHSDDLLYPRVVDIPNITRLNENHEQVLVQVH